MEILCRHGRRSNTLETLSFPKDFNIYDANGGKKKKFYFRQKYSSLMDVHKYYKCMLPIFRNWTATDGVIQLPGIRATVREGLYVSIHFSGEKA